MKKSKQSGWHYQVVWRMVPSGISGEPLEKFFEVREFFRREDGSPWAWTGKPIQICGEDIKGILWQLKTAMKDVKRYKPLSEIELRKEMRAKWMRPK